MNHKVIWRPQARTDLLALYDWLAEVANPEVAFSYTSRIGDACAELATFPGRGSPRPDLADGVRTTAFQRRVIIAYLADEDVVTILRIISGARDMDRLFEEE